jgi:hypothetical protein
MMARTVAERLAAGLERKPNGCLEWTKATNRHGYGLIGVDGRSRLAHRVAWTLANGPIPEGMCVLHRCDNPPCCDVEGCLFLGTQADNVTDMETKGRGRQGDFQRDKTHCVAGHEFSGANLRIGERGQRVCMECRRVRQQASRAAHRLEFPSPNPGAYQLAKTKCPHGHSYDDVNTYVTPKGSRMCRTCMRARNRKRRGAAA